MSFPFRLTECFLIISVMVELGESCNLSYANPKQFLWAQLKSPFCQCCRCNKLHNGATSLNGWQMLAHAIGLPSHCQRRYIGHGESNGHGGVMRHFGGKRWIRTYAYYTANIGRRRPIGKMFSFLSHTHSDQPTTTTIAMHHSWHTCMLQHVYSMDCSIYVVTTFILHLKVVYKAVVPKLCTMVG